MGLFGKGKQGTTTDPLNPEIVRELQSASRKKFTGVIEVVDKPTGSTALLYLFEGGIYAVDLQDYTPRVADRLLSAGTIDEDKRKWLFAQLGPDPRHLGAGPLAVQEGWLSAESLATVHQEYLLASLGAVLARPKVRMKQRKGESTSDFCTLPLPIEPLFETMRMRAGRLATGWGALEAAGDPSNVALSNRGVPIPDDLALPEFAALAAEANGHRSVDVLADELGFTLAEITHMAMLLVRAGVLRVSPEATSGWEAGRLPVPEAFGVILATRGQQPGPEAVAPAAAVAVESSSVFAPTTSDDTSSSSEAESTPDAPVDDRPDAPDDDRSEAAWAAAVVATAAVASRDSGEMSPSSDTPDAAPTSSVFAAAALASAGEKAIDDSTNQAEVAAIETPESAPAGESVDGEWVDGESVDGHVLQLRRETALEEAAELERLLDRLTKEEMEAITRASAVRTRLQAVQASIDGVEGELRGGTGAAP
jgi:hypothetical protein